MDEPRPQDLQEAPEPLSGGSVPVPVPVPEPPEDGDDADTAQLLAGQRQPRGFWTFEYYQAFFDVDTRQVLERIKASLVPVPGKNFVRHRLRNNPDLYGPFWIGATLALALALSADLSQLGPARPGPAHRYRPRFHLVPVALSLVFSYAGLLPLALWGSLRWARGGSGGSGGSFSLLQTLSAFGYSLSGLVPAAVLWALPLAWLRWALLALLALPGATLAVTFWPPLRAGGRGAALAGGAALLALHLLLALGCQLYFLEPLPTAGSGSGGAPTGGDPPLQRLPPLRLRGGWAWGPPGWRGPPPPWPPRTPPKPRWAARPQ
ncbi:protein YIPF2 [Haemorhous mexicanus]|uniref:protein YIPF2 n=1 Tax=Haemorhous mexicanus TaxID=30427 RepID=UPI0028BEA965|nr:protein YIPF2 [Haemorhous mexicanus]